MIIGFIGNRGSGKTLSMTKEAYGKFKAGYRIYSNYKLNFAYEPYTIEMLLDYASAGAKFKRSIFLVDEAHVYLDSRTPAKKRNRIFTLFITQSRKADVDIYYSTQFPRQVDVRLRIHTDIVVQCSGYKSLYKGHEINIIFNEIREFQYSGNDKVLKKIFIGNKYYNLYDTTEVISMLEEDK